MMNAEKGQVIEMLMMLTPPAWMIAVIMLLASIELALIGSVPVYIRLMVIIPLVLITLSYSYFERGNVPVDERILISRYALLLHGMTLCLIGAWYHTEKKKILIQVLQLHQLEAEKKAWLQEQENWELRNENLIRRLGELSHELQKTKGI